MRAVPLDEWFRVEVTDGNGMVIAIEPEMLAGRDIRDVEEATIIRAIEHLSGFIGKAAIAAAPVDGLVERLEFIANHTHNVVAEEIEEVCDLAAAALQSRDEGEPVAVDWERQCGLLGIALGDLSFACFAGLGTQPPSAEVYNRTFAVLQQWRDGKLSEYWAQIERDAALWRSHVATAVPTQRGEVVAEHGACGCWCPACFKGDHAACPWGYCNHKTAHPAPSALPDSLPDEPATPMHGNNWYRLISHIRACIKCAKTPEYAIGLGEWEIIAAALEEYDTAMSGPAMLEEPLGLRELLQRTAKEYPISAGNYLPYIEALIAHRGRK